ncbi:PorT family protein [Pedobacter polaris]|uniref:PorT family protein n=1 Tax=Pedobacter polaris TaxID=2571273 RepID=A0A4U1CXR4_9SPHI|nr:outer membrane beta-barrel protein [Pedobacter polaris]TKC12269.1 PorT family protein [Pedobacter polaris]
MHLFQINEKLIIEMKELNDNDFDQAFKTRITEEFPEFEEESWLKMEKKLRKRERVTFLRYASILLLLLSFGATFYILNRKNEAKTDTVVVENIKNRTKVSPQLTKPSQEEVALDDKSIAKNIKQTPNVVNQGFEVIQSNIAPAKNPIPIANTPVQNSSNANIKNNQEAVVVSQGQPADQAQQDVIASSDPVIKGIDLVKPKTEIQTKVKRKIPISVAILAGPDFSSTSSLIGGKSGVTIGFTVGIGLTKKLSLQTGMSYGSKNYSASAYDYTFNNPTANKANFSGINAACKVIEIPLRASYNISENQKRSIELNAGLSTYLMTKENYVFKYNQTLNRADRITNVSNANQHYLGVIDLSATYNIKLKNKKFAFGMEPYIKIPLTGIGEGSVPLKSSGISLKLRYDFNK